ncbi:MAG: response regulator [Pseudolabrys sp.]|nr:response regulator [Pseudolabrys sp.]
MSSHYRILAVDDDALMGSIVVSALGTEPAFIVESCDNGKDAIAKATLWSPDLILCDLLMPDMDGFEVLRQLLSNEATATIPLIFMTGRGAVSDIEAMMALGAAAVITKPFKLNDLIAIVRRELFMPEASAVESPLPAYDFAARMHADAASLREFRQQLAGGSAIAALNNCAHRLAGAAGIYGFGTVSAAASAVEQRIASHRAGNGSLGDVDHALEHLIKHIGTFAPNPGIHSGR